MFEFVIFYPDHGWTLHRTVNPKKEASLKRKDFRYGLREGDTLCFITYRQMPLKENVSDFLIFWSAFKGKSETKQLYTNTFF